MVRLKLEENCKIYKMKPSSSNEESSISKVANYREREREREREALD
jgi:hypothetical protein